MATANLVQDVTAVSSALTTAVSDAAAFVAFNTDSSGAPVVNRGHAGQVNNAEALLKALHACQQLLNDTRFQSGSAIDATVTIS